MSSIIVFDPNKTPAPVLQFIPSNADPAAYSGRPDVLVDPSLSPVTGLAQIYWKVSGGALAPMSAGEQAAINSAITTALIAANESGATGELASLDPNAELIRAVGGVLVDEINLVREWFVSFQVAVAASTSLANLQTRVAALPAMPDRSLAQFKTAVQNKISSGVVDS